MKFGKGTSRQGGAFFDDVKRLEFTNLHKNSQFFLAKSVDILYTVK